MAGPTPVSGQRRPFDLQHCMEALTAVSKLPLICLSIDVALDRDRCDLTVAQVIDLWIKAILAGRVVAVVAGPPCGTWSVSRHMLLPDGSGPRPLRSPQLPWGIDGLSTRERADLELASALLRSTIHLLYAAVTAGITFVMEHPAEPVWKPECASSWRLPELAHAFTCLGVDRVLIHQCSLGAPSMKPTELAIANAPSLVSQAASYRCPRRGHNHSSLMRRLPDGTFATAAAKEYPPGMCAWLAAGIHHAAAVALNTRWRCESSDLWDGATALAVSHLYVPLDPYLDSHAAGAWAPDTAAGTARPPSALPDQASADVTPLLGGDLPWLPPPCIGTVSDLALDRLAERRTKALVRRSDQQLGRPLASAAVRFCGAYRPPVARAPVLLEEPRFNLTALDTTRPGTGATRRNRFRFS